MLGIFVSHVENTSNVRFHDLNIPFCEEIKGSEVWVWYYCNVSFSGNTNFTNNSAEVEDGSGVTVLFYSTVNFSGNTSFTNNSAGYGGGVMIWPNSTVSFSGNTSSYEVV